MVFEKEINQVDKLQMVEARAWCREEFSNIQLGDKRLNQRWIKTAELLSTQPTNYINQACENWAATKAAYRLFDNERVTPRRIMAPHQQMTFQRMQSAEKVLCIQDTTFLNYNSHPSTQGLGHIGSRGAGQSARGKGSQGLIMHTSLAIDPSTLEGLPLGILDQDIWARKRKTS